jgi:hypothetical protein
MFFRTRFHFVTFVMASALVAFCTGGTPARAEEMVQHRGPVTAYEPILATVGDARVIAFYVPHGKNCAVHAVVWSANDTNANTASRTRVLLKLGQITHIDRPDQSLALRCAHRSLAVVDIGEDRAFKLER